MKSTSTKVGMFLSAAIVLLSSCKGIQKTDKQSSNLTAISEVEGRDKLAMGEFLKVIQNKQHTSGLYYIIAGSLEIEHVSDLNGDDSYVVKFRQSGLTKTREIFSNSEGYESVRRVYFYLLDETGNDGRAPVKVDAIECEFVEQDGFPGTIVTTKSCSVHF